MREGPDGEVLAVGAADRRKIGVKEGAELVSSDISLDGVVYEKLYVAVSGI